MAQIKQLFLDNLKEAHKAHGISSVTGVYDGLDGVLTINFSDGDTVSCPFQYDSITAGLDSVSGFRELLFDVSGIIIQDYNAKYPHDNDYFMQAVTE